MWLILVACKSGGGRNQHELAASIGIRGATLTHHLDAMEDRELLSRRRDPENRRVHIIELTQAGERMFHQLREVATTFDGNLRAGISNQERATFESVLQALVDNVSAGAASAGAASAGAASADVAQTTETGR